MRHTGVIAIKEAGKTIEQEFVEVLLKNNPTGLGAATISPEKGLQVGIIDKAISVEAFMHTQKLGIKQKMIFFFANFPKDSTAVSLQPFELLGGKAAIFSDGNFQSFSQPESKHSDDFFFANQYMAEKLKDFHDLVGGDMKKLKEALKRPLAQKEITGQWTGRGHIVLVFSDGEHMEWKSNMLAKDTPWGMVSNDYDFYKKEAAPEPAPAAKEETDVMGLFSGKTSAEPVSASHGPHIVAETQEIADAVAKLPVHVEGNASLASATVDLRTSTALPASSGKGAVSEGTQLLAPPPNCTTRKELRAWYTAKAGFVPENYKRRPKVEVPIVSVQGAPIERVEANAITKQAAEEGGKQTTQPNRAQDHVADHTPKSVAEKRAAKATSVPSSPPLQEQFRKEIENAKAAEKVETGEDQYIENLRAQSASTDIPKIPLEQVKKINSDFLKKSYRLMTLDVASKKIMDPNEIAKLNEKVANFAQQIGLEDNTCTLTWDLQDLRELCNKYPDAAAVLLLNRGNQIIEENYSRPVPLDAKPAPKQEVQQSAPRSGAEIKERRRVRL